MSLPNKVKELMDRGVSMPHPLSVEIGDEVSPERISGRNVVIHGCTKINGAKTLLSEGTKIGCEGPVTLVDCFVGPHVELSGGFFQSSVFLEKVKFASGAHVRAGTLLEEEAKAGHTVGLKQTILFPFVTLGSLINFCDCLMAGGSGRNSHSEVGSSYVHFNYTPQQDKATPSLIGDVPRGVMLNQRPIFLGGQGGLVGPVRIDYGTVITAGTVWRRDSEGAKMLHGEESRPLNHDYNHGCFGDLRKKIYNNIIYIANLLALKQWYYYVRRPFLLRRELGDWLFRGAMETIDLAIEERLRCCRDFSRKAGNSAAIIGKGGGKEDLLYQQRDLMEKWPALEESFSAPLNEYPGGRERDDFLGILEEQGRTFDYIEFILGLDERAKLTGTDWLQHVVDGVTGRALACLPSLSSRPT